MEFCEDFELSPNREVVDLTKTPLYQRFSPYKCVISNKTQDIICHTIFIISGSEFFRALHDDTEEKFEIEPGVLVPRIKVNFDESLIYPYIQFAYFSTIEIQGHSHLNRLLSFASFLNSTEILQLLEFYTCKMAIHLSPEELDDYLYLANTYWMGNLRTQLQDQKSRFLVNAPGVSVSSTVVSTIDEVD